MITFKSHAVELSIRAECTVYIRSHGFTGESRAAPACPGLSKICAKQSAHQSPPVGSIYQAQFGSCFCPFIKDATISSSVSLSPIISTSRVSASCEHCRGICLLGRSVAVGLLIHRIAFSFSFSWVWSSLVLGLRLCDPHQPANY